MKLGVSMYFVPVLFAMCLVACDQKKADFPDMSGTAGECGPWYPGVDNDAGDSEYAVEKDKIFPCFVWESVNTNGENTWLNVGDLHLAVKHGQSNARALVIPVVGTDCVGCTELIAALGEMEQGYNEVAVMLALTHGGITSTDTIPLDEAVWAILAKGWPVQWSITNDVENYFPTEDYNGIPWVVVIRLSDMKVVERSNINYTASNVDELLTLIQNL